jgi:hypothetical protein
MESENFEGQSICFESRKFGLNPLKISLHLLVIFFLAYKDCGLVERRGEKKDPFKASCKNENGRGCRS